MLKLLLSAEHASNDVPAHYQSLFAKEPLVLNTHRGFDPGTKTLTKALSSLADEVHFAQMSRLIIELNRSLHHRSLFSKYSEALAESEKNKLIHDYYFAYRNKIEQTILQWIHQGHNVLHVSVHSFTPALDGIKRKADIGLLYDPTRALEKPFSALWKQALNQHCPEWKVRFNYPYLGKADGFTTYLRKKFSGKHYLGIELETNQALWQEAQAAKQSEYQKVIFDSLKEALGKTAF